MTDQRLTPDEKRFLLTLARNAITYAVNNRPLPEIDINSLTEPLKAHGASFVTLTREKQLRGCIGTLEAYQPLVLDVREHAVAAALEDHRFDPLTSDELAFISIEVSRLTHPKSCKYSSPEELLELLHPGIDGVILSDGQRRATFLPQVWEQLPNPEDFLSHLCYKMGASPDSWQNQHLDVSIYQVEEFHE
ncbi:MAG: AmmeMemoRadiSam system protein A [Anaerolineaceae bacterium]|nr:AmmeMemoRadiSam system protein A [Anaerolineaceae bacterium]MBN2678057.1 AmmeMemoRadiSam system protein A [Anaerolineaceae bacterium]